MPFRYTMVTVVVASVAATVILVVLMVISAVVVALVVVAEPAAPNTMPRVWTSTPHARTVRSPELPLRRCPAPDYDFRPLSADRKRAMAILHEDHRLASGI